MHANRGILSRNSRLLRQVAELAILQIHNPQRIPIFRLESREKAGNTLADLLPQGCIWLLAFREFPPGFHGPCRAGPVAVMIDDGVAEHPIEPGDHFLIRHTTSSFQSARKRCLQDIFGGGPGLDAPFQERQKLAVAGNQLRKGFGR
jgi:transposase